MDFPSSVRITRRAQPSLTKLVRIAMGRNLRLQVEPPPPKPLRDQIGEAGLVNLINRLWQFRELDQIFTQGDELGQTAFVHIMAWAPSIAEDIGPLPGNLQSPKRPI